MTSAKKILFINPPVAKPSEPPAGIARLAGGMRDQGIDCSVLDLSLSCLLAQFEDEIEANDRWSKRANRNRHRNIAQLRLPELYHSFDRYQHVVNDLGRVLDLAGRKNGCRITLANYEDSAWTPLCSSDLLASAEQFETNHFHTWFSPLLKEALAAHQPEYIGLSLSYLSQALTGFAALPAFHQNLDSQMIKFDPFIRQARLFLMDDGHSGQQHGIFGQPLQAVGPGGLHQIRGLPIRLGFRQVAEMVLSAIPGLAKIPHLFFVERG